MSVGWQTRSGIWLFDFAGHPGHLRISGATRLDDKPGRVADRYEVSLFKVSGSWPVSSILQI